MKKWFFILIIPLLFIVLIILMIDNKKIEQSKIITISSLNSYIYDNDNLINIPFYVNNKDLNYENKNIYNSFYLKNENETIVIELELDSVTYSHAEKMDGIFYYKYHFKFLMPEVVDDIKISDAYLKFNLSNNHKLTLKIGSFNIKTKNTLEEITHVSNLYAKRYSDDYIITEIVLEELEIKGEINNINLGDNILLEHNNDLNNLVIKPNQKLYINNVPIIIETSIKTFYINNFVFIEDYNLLSKNNTLLNVYEFN